MQPDLKIIKSMGNASRAERQTHTKMDTIQVTPELVANWKKPPFQRTLLINSRVRVVVDAIKEAGGVIPGILTLGMVGSDTYLVDGQHRTEAFKMTGLKEGFADVRIHWFANTGEMAQEFEQLNSALVNWKPDDILRARESYMPALQELRKLCPFIGYTMVRRSTGSPLVSMSAVLRCWFGSETEVPAASGGKSARDAAERLTIDEARALAAFLEMTIDAWGRDPEFYRLWGNLTLSLCMWLYRRTVISAYSPKTTRLTREQFRKGLQSLSSDERFLEYLVGRGLNDTSRAPTYNRIKTIFAGRLEGDFGGKTARGATKVNLPQPAWAHG
ncbi:MAG TPA: ParB/Srx family N-terminal domain-containing protein [Burkholderiales bacterium]|nr:ParB/Srx family N-terminal domain-containing protein [Burkholderiales bacterium]